MKDRDALLLEAVNVHRARLMSALTFGPLRARRPVNTNVKRLLGSVVLAAVACIACLAVSFVGNVMTEQAGSRYLELRDDSDEEVPPEAPPPVGVATLPAPEDLA